MRGRQKTLPEVLGEYTRRSTARFHSPGHKGRGVEMPERLALWDVPALPDAGGALQTTQQAFARAYGARDCFLLSSDGCTAMLLSLGPGKRVLMARDCDPGAVAGAALAGQDVEFVYPPPGGMLTPAAVDAALHASPADAVLLKSPDYLGRCADVAGIAAVARDHGALTLLDAAHGAHFPFAPDLPDLPAVELFCVRAYETLNALTPATLLFTGPESPMDPGSVKAALALLQGAPSWPLLASLDWALHTARDWQAHVLRIQTLQKRIRAVNGLRPGAPGGPGVIARDPARLVVNVRGRGISGFTARADLLSKGVVPETADAQSIVCLTTPRDPEDWYERLYTALSTLPYGTREQAAQDPAPEAERALSLREAVFAPSECVPLSEAVGRIAACMVGGVPGPALFPGERISREMPAYLLAQRALGYTLMGLEGKDEIRVVR